MATQAITGVMEVGPRLGRGNFCAQKSSPLQKTLGVKPVFYQPKNLKVFARQENFLQKVFKHINNAKFPKA
jgi:hypothetical protein